MLGAEDILRADDFASDVGDGGCEIHGLRAAQIQRGSGGVGIDGDFLAEIPDLRAGDEMDDGLIFGEAVVLAYDYLIAQRVISRLILARVEDIAFVCFGEEGLTQKHGAASRGLDVIQRIGEHEGING